MRLPIQLREILDKRCRGGSKTFDKMELALYLASIGFVGIWFGSVKDQIEQPKKYMKFIIENSYLKFLIAPGGLLKESVEFQSGGSLRLKNLTELNARSSRADFIVYDEEAQADKDAYNAAVNILAGSYLGLIIHISTPCKGSVFEENYDRLKHREIIHGEQFVFSRSWEEIERFRKRADWYAEEKERLPDWYFQQEHCAEFVLPMGAVFQNVQYGPYPDWLMEAIQERPICNGIDWNPVAGHMLVGTKWTSDLKHHVVTEEIDLGKGYVADLKDEMFHTIAVHASFGNHVNYECSGINEEYVRWVQRKKGETGFNYPDQNWHSEEWDSAGVNKLRIVTFIIQTGVCIWVDKEAFPNTAKQIEDCSWDPESPIPKLKKDPASSPHYLDAYLHAASEENRRDTRFEFGEWY